MASFATALAAVFWPVVTIYGVWLALGMAALAGLFGSRIWPPLAMLTCVLNLFFLSPVSLSLLGGNLFSMISTAALFGLAAWLWTIGLRRSLEKAFKRHEKRQGR